MDARRSPAQQVAAQPAPPGPLGGAEPSPSGSGAGLLPACVAGTLGPSAKAAGTLAAKPGRPQVPGARAIEVGWGRATCRETPRAGSRTWTRCPCLRAAGSASRSLNGATDIQEFPDLKGTSSLETL